MPKVKVTRCERVTNPYYKAVVENPCIISEHDFDDENSANEFINGDIDKYAEKYPNNDTSITRIEVPWQVGASIRDRSRFGGLFILYNKETL